MNTEITDTKNGNGFVCFDALCPLCSNLARRFDHLLHRHGFSLLPLQTRWVKERLTNDGRELLSELRLITQEGRIHGGADALIEIARHVWWARPIYWLSLVPLARVALSTGYRWVARNRKCVGGRCSVAAAPNSSWAGTFAWASALVPALLTVSFGRTLPGWVRMWAMAAALFFLAKWITLLRTARPLGCANPARLLAYVFLWPGMDAVAFCENRLNRRPPGREWVFAAAKTLFGLAVIWVGVPSMGPARPLVTGWVGMVGLVFLLHFGLFHLLSLAWRALGIDARPIMRSPVTAISLGEFWGGSWNAAFSDLMRGNAFKPLTRRVGPRGAVGLVFLISGALHELVISVPARGGYGLPTAYFALQGLGLLFEKSKGGQKLGLGSGWRGWCFVALIAGAPAFWLFHPLFIRHVILPMLRAIGST